MKVYRHTILDIEDTHPLTGTTTVRTVWLEYEVDPRHDQDYVDWAWEIDSSSVCTVTREGGRWVTGPSANLTPSEWKDARRQVQEEVEGDHISILSEMEQGIADDIADQDIDQWMIDKHQSRWEN